MAGPVLRVALTGGIATGKSHCLHTFARLGVPVIDADVIARDALAPGTAALGEVQRRFGAEIVAGGELDRKALARVVFADQTARRALEAIVHPVVYAAIEAWFADLDARGGADLAIADIPLLYETGRERDFDRVVVAACSPDLQRTRVMARDGVSADDADRRIASQMPIDEKRRRADYVIDTNGAAAGTDATVAEVLSRLKTDAARRAR